MNKQLKILIFTKDETLGSLLQECLTSEEFATETYANETEAYDRFCNVGFHLCVIDVSPNHKEVLLANAFKAITDDVKLIFLMDNPAKEDIIEVFGSGADDMMRKPISLEILQARINAIMKRTFDMQPKQSVIFRFGIFTFNTHAIAVHRHRPGAEADHQRVGAVKHLVPQRQQPGRPHVYPAEHLEKRQLLQCPQHGRLYHQITPYTERGSEHPYRKCTR